MNRKFFSLSLVILAAFWMAACSDSEISSSDISTITQSIFIVPIRIRLHAPPPTHRCRETPVQRAGAEVKVKKADNQRIPLEEIATETHIT